MIELVAGDARHPVLATVAPVDGGRVVSLSVHGTELLVGGDSSSNPLHWGSYPMVPFAGRIRHGRFRFRGVEHQLPTNMAPHAIHGSGFTSRWEILDVGSRHVELECRLQWPFGGRAHQHIHLADDALLCVLTVVADGEAMPVTLGWHPWFVKPPADRFEFAAMYLRDAEGIPTGELVPPPERPWDDCFVRPLATPELRYPGLTVRIESDCDHWVVYDQPSHATCVEPQSGPPDAVNLGSATVLEAGEFLQRSMTVRWLPAGSV